MSEYEIPDIFRFTEGDCHILAVEMWEISDDDILLANIDGHAFVVRDSDKVALDVEGPRPLKKLLKQWNTEEWEVWTKENYEKEWGLTPMFGEESLEKAKNLAPKLLKELEAYV